ncbi:phosphate/phosphite/phosphonate ABC transporter substrate-binding protein [Enterococcus sp.]|uniref:phosphate/phosphite/phosphonate ABC transporter substrate-binding protein n=1 Tax=Enterococcus sp. TaxID=35783 RepID=UPI0029088C9F|nr:phosphate/phosphite/phosphonate ABC transporter substrate-binding protein [Enterococcus sp.]MDU5334506.1 phosphate/phosphite/phosphonate ABC transporter substrate-binding protein [Enterococcus sp.]
MKKIFSKMILVMVAALAVTGLAGCGNGNGNATAEQKKDSPLKVIFYPNESAAEFEKSRDALKDIISDATGRKVKIVTTTDYNIVIESIANGQADLALMGAEGYIQAHKKNPDVKPIVTNSGASGTLEDALYYSFIAVKEENEKNYQSGDGYTIDPIKGKTFSFVSNSSTSGFKVPSSAIVKEFGLKDSDELINEGKFFDKVLFGGSHQGSAVNLLKGDADAAAFMNLPQYFDVADGEENKTGMLYQVKDDAEAPFDTVRGEKARVILSTPVLNAPIAANTKVMSQKEIDQVVEALTSKEVAENEDIFAPKDSDQAALFVKEGDERFLEVQDKFYDPIRELSK